MVIILPISDAGIFDYPVCFYKKKRRWPARSVCTFATKEKLMEGEFPQYVVTKERITLLKQKEQRMLPLAMQY